MVELYQYNVKVYLDGFNNKVFYLLPLELDF